MAWLLDVVGMNSYHPMIIVNYIWCVYYIIYDIYNFTYTNNPALGLGCLYMADKKFKFDHVIIITPFSIYTGIRCWYIGWFDLKELTLRSGGHNQQVIQLLHGSHFNSATETNTDNIY